MSTRQYPKLRGAQPPAPEENLPQGTIGIISGELSRYSIFSMNLINLMGYSAQHGIVSHWNWLMGSNITGNCNDLARSMQGEWLWMIGDDHMFHPDLLVRLLRHDVDVIGPHCLQKAWPFPQVVYEGEERDATVQGTHRLHQSLPRDELVEVHAVGGAGLLIKRQVLEAIGDPYFETYGKQNEDLEFCRKVRNAGFKIHCDTGALLGHIGTLVSWPVWDEEHGGWGARVDLGGDGGRDVLVRRYYGEGAEHGKIVDGDNLSW